MSDRTEDRARVRRVSPHNAHVFGSLKTTMSRQQQRRSRATLVKSQTTMLRFEYRAAICSLKQEMSDAGSGAWTRYPSRDSATAAVFGSSTPAEVLQQHNGETWSRRTRHGLLDHLAREAAEPADEDAFTVTCKCVNRGLSAGELTIIEGERRRRRKRGDVLERQRLKHAQFPLSSCTPRPMNTIRSSTSHQQQRQRCRQATLRILGSVERRPTSRSPTVMQC